MELTSCVPHIYSKINGLCLYEAVLLVIFMTRYPIPILFNEAILDILYKNGIKFNIKFNLRYFVLHKIFDLAEWYQIFKEYNIIVSYTL